MPASIAEAFGGLLLIALASLPAGLLILRGVEAGLRHRFSLTPVERVVLAIYATGTLLYLLASLPVPIYGRTLLATVLVGGALVYGYLLLRAHLAGLRSVARSILRPDFILVTAGFLGLLLFELIPIWSHPFPDAWDGSVTALWTNLILQHGSVPANLEPYASAPVLYPMGTAVWMSVPVLFYGWSAVQSPILLPPLFLSLTVPAAYAWGVRWCRSAGPAQTPVGLLFAAFFGLVASIPRFYTGGWYDFALALPLLILVIGLLPECVERIPGSRSATVGLGLCCGAMTALSLAAGESVAVLVLAFVIVRHFGAWRKLLSGVLAVFLLILFEMAFTLRSIAGWVSFQGASYVPTHYYGSLGMRLILGELDPFVPWKAKLSPIPAAALELQILLGVGLAFALVSLLWPKVAEALRVNRDLARHLLTGTVAAFVMTAVLLVTTLSNGPAEALAKVTNLDQSSVVLFLFFTGVALLPLASVVIALSSAGPSPVDDKAASERSAETAGPGTLGRLPRRRASRGGPATLVTVLVIALTVGAVTTVIDGPNYLQSNVGKTSDVTAGDVTALEWAASHLPACSVVLVAPGSAAQFLPEYASVRMVFPMNPVPTNSSYQVVVSNLTGGEYTGSTRAALLSLGVTEVFVTGQTSVSYAPFLAQPLVASPDFSELFAAEDATIFEFSPGVAESSCGPG